MGDIEQRIKELADKIESLQSRQYGISNELRILHNELFDLRNSLAVKPESNKNTNAITPEKRSIETSVVKQLTKPLPPQNIAPKQRLEDFIGTNLISKLGILITIIGIFIGAKYAIDKELISPAMRILIGYAAGATLILTAVRLKIKYENFSAVLMGGGLAVLYFITYISYGFYQLFSQAVSFLLMVAITVAAVAIALWYNQKIIAIIGQVAAYAIPFLLNNGSGNVLILFSYISIINIGLLILSFKRDWKILYRTAFIVTWIIYGSWVLFNHPDQNQTAIGLDFLFINFFTFYATFLIYKVVKKELYQLAEIVVLLLNALLFFFIGIYLIDIVYPNPHVLTYFTILNAVIHFTIGGIIYRQKLADHSAYQFIIGLGILFITISIPVELNGSWVSLLWAVESTVLSWIAFKNFRKLYLIITIPMIIIAGCSLLQDWFLTYPHLKYINANGDYSQPFLNLNFLFSLFIISCFGYISWLSYKSEMRAGSFVASFFNLVMPIVFVIGLYFVFFNEIHFAWDIFLFNSHLKNQLLNIDNDYETISLIVFSLLYFSLCFNLNTEYFKRRSATDLLLLPASIAVLIFLTEGLNSIGNLRQAYIDMQSQNLNPSMLMLGVRYISFIALAILVWSVWKALKLSSKKKDTLKIFSSAFNFILLTVICNEFIHWMHLGGYQNQYKLGLTIIWGLYALVLIFVGIKNKQKHLRISAIILFGITLLKLFFYDLSSLPAVSKTIVLVILGVILLIVSFLYNKYKQIIFGDDEEIKNPI